MAANTPNIHIKLIITAATLLFELTAATPLSTWSLAETKQSMDTILVEFMLPRYSKGVRLKDFIQPLSGRLLRNIYSIRIMAGFLEKIFYKLEYYLMLKIRQFFLF